MSKKIEVETLKRKIWENSLRTCEYISGTANAKSKIVVRCVKHNIIFEVSYDTIRKSTRKHHICPECKKEDNNANKVTLTCDLCGKQYLAPKSKAYKSDFHFCCRACKDSAQKIGSGKKFDNLRPDRYGIGQTAYRTRALEVYEHKCEICNWADDVDVLEVHHIDGDRTNAALDNLIVLCPTCHKKLTIGKYRLDRIAGRIIKN